MYNYPSDTEITTAVLAECIGEHDREIKRRLSKLQKMYLSDHDILHRKKKDTWKPDNRIVVNFAKYLVDTMNGYFCGVPISVIAPEEENEINEYIEYLHGYNDVDNLNAELEKLCDIFGRGYEIYYSDEEAQLCIAYVSPLEGIMVRDDSIKEKPLFFIRRYKDKNGVEYGSVSDREAVRYFKNSASIEWTSEWEEHNFGDVPATEYIQNDERQGLFEPAITMIEAYEKAVSEKANDVDAFADAYLKILGADVDQRTMKQMRDTRTINLTGEDAETVVVDFLAKPQADATQENLIDRLEKLIFHISMVANIGDENFGTSSGIAMKYRLQGMDNLAKAKERKFAASLARRYKLIFGHAANTVSEDAWTKLQYKFTANIPNNLADEADTATKLEGIVSKETQLKTLSIVDNVSEEIKALEEEQAPIANTRFGVDPYVNE